MSFEQAIAVFCLAATIAFISYLCGFFTAALLATSDPKDTPTAKQPETIKKSPDIEQMPNIVELENKFIDG